MGVSGETDVPPVCMTDDGCEHDPGSRFGELPSSGDVKVSRRTKHPTQAASIMHSNDPDVRQGHRTGITVADSNLAVAILAEPVAKSEAVSATSLFLWLREADATPIPFVNLPIAVGGKSAAEVDSSLLEDLRRHLVPPSEPSHLLRGRPVTSNDKDSAGCFTSLPCVEAIDEIEARPRYVHRGITLMLSTCVGEQPETLIIGEARCARVPRQQLSLRWREVQSEPKCRIAHDGPDTMRQV